MGYDLKLAFMYQDGVPNYGCLQLYKAEGSPYAKIDILSVAPEVKNEDFLGYSNEFVLQFFPYEKVLRTAWGRCTGK